MVITLLSQIYHSESLYVSHLSFDFGKLFSVVIIFYLFICQRLFVRLFSCRLAHCVERYSSLDLVPFLFQRVFGDNLIPTPDVVSFETDKGSALWTHMLMVSKAPFLSTGKNRSEAAAPEAKCKQDEAHYPR